MTDRWVLVTGASTGIGKATALHLAARGYRVFAGVRREADGAALAAKGAGIAPIILDVTKGEDIAAAKAQVAQTTGEAGLFALINNAGYNYISPFEFTDEAQARTLMEINFFGLARVSQAFAPLLRQAARHGDTTSKLINVASIGGLIGLPWEPFYHASKFAVVGLSESLRQEFWAQNVRVTAICPGGIKTPFLAKTGTSIAEAQSALSAEGRALYGARLKKFEAALAAATRLGAPPRRVARKIAWTLQQRDPPLKTLVGADARLIRTLSTLLPESWAHGLVRAML